MVHAPDPHPSPADGAPQLDCAKALRLIDQQVVGSLPGPVVAILRRHLAGCADCRAGYRERVEAVASLGRGAAQRVASARAGARAGIGRPHHRSRFGSAGLRRFIMIVVPALLFFLATRIDSSWEFEPPLMVSCLEGTAWVGGEVLERPMGPRRLRRSDVLATEPDTRARIDARKFELELEPQTRLLVISALTRRVRLEEGTLAVRGDSRIETPLGVVEVSAGEARVRIDGAGLDVVAESGRVTVVDASGRRVVPLDDGPSER